MGRLCTVCECPDRASVEIGLANGIAARVLGKRYGLSPDALHRHGKDHMDDELRARLRVRGMRSDQELAHIREVESKTLLEHLSWQRARLYRNADRCYAIDDMLGERVALDSAGKASERIGKLLGELGSHITVNNHTINLVQSPEWHLIRTALVRELRPLGVAAIAAGARAIAAAEASIAHPIEPERLPVLIEAKPL